MGQTLGRVEDISARLAEKFQQFVPLTPQPLKGQKRPDAREVAVTTERALSQFYAAAHQERLAYRLGIVARARVAIALQKRLTQAGYPVALVKQVLFAMLTAAFVADK
jgi:hypothetical protein